MLTDLEKDGVVFLTGDVHFGIMSQSPCAAFTGYHIPEITSSGMTHIDADLLIFSPEKNA